jgi:hypothetical protein
VFVSEGSKRVRAQAGWRLRVSVVGGEDQDQQADRVLNRFSVIEPIHDLPQGYVGVSDVIMQSYMVLPVSEISIAGPCSIPHIGRARCDNRFLEVT